MSVHRFNDHRMFVWTHFPFAVCRRDHTDKGPGISYAIYADDPKKYPALNLRLTGGWMTPGQAWERCSAGLETKR